MKMEQSVPKRRHIKFRRRGITQKKTYMFLLVSVAEWMMWLKEFCRKISASFDKQYLAMAFGNVRFTADSSPPPDYPFSGSEFISKHKPSFISGTKG
jgi:hypothetical protein